MAPALPLLKKIGGYRNEDRRNEKRSEADSQRLRCRGAFEPGSGQKEKKGLGGPRNPLKSLNLDKENKVNSFDFLGRALLDLARFGFAWKIQIHELWANISAALAVRAYCVRRPGAATSSPSFRTVRQLRNVDVTRSFESNQALVSFVRATPEGRRR